MHKTHVLDRKADLIYGGIIFGRVQMRKRGINRKETIPQIAAPTKAIHLKLISFSKWFLGAQLLGAVLNIFSVQIIIICSLVWLSAIVAIISSKHPSNNYVRQLIVHNKVSRSEKIEIISVVSSAVMLLYVFYLYIEKLIVSA